MTFTYRPVTGLGMLALVSGARGPSSGSPAPKPAAGPDPAVVAEGQGLIAQKGCGGCHTIPGVAGASAAIGPNLAGVASRTTIR